MKKKIFIIAEIGINHNGSIKIAKELMQKAKACGCDAVKFQKRVPEISTPEQKKDEFRDTPWGKITYLNYKKKIELNRKEYDQIDSFAKKIDIDWFASAWDIDSLNFLKKYKLKYNKIASAMLTNLELLKAVASEKKYTFISTGMSSMKDVTNAVNIFKKKKCKFMLMHSVSTYPCAEKDLNLMCIKTLKKKYKCSVGYSGHESTLSPTLGACYLGADAIERHITLDRAMWGTDQAASLSISGLKDLVGMVRKINLIVGDGKKKIIKDEKKKIKDLRYW